ncbi:MAG: PilN domain-containing protein [Gammaproteobacteria bacterium]
MNQQINLYQPMFRRQEKVFSAAMMIQTVSLFIALLAVIYFYGYYQINPLEEQLSKTESDLVKLRSQVDKYRQTGETQGKSKLLEDQVSRLQQELNERRKVRDTLASQQIGTGPEFSNLMEALARQHIEGTWLTAFEISAGGKALSLNGRTLSSSLVPRYMQRLGEESVMAGIAFNNVEMQRSAQEDRQAGDREMIFYISTN